MKQLFTPNTFKIPHVELPDEKRLVEAIMQLQSTLVESAGKEISAPIQRIERVEVSGHLLKGLIGLATNAWRARTKMIDGHSMEVREEMKGVHRHIEAIWRNLNELELEIKDHTGDPYDEGQPMKVIASESTVGISKAVVKETLLPTIYFKSQIVLHGEIVVAAPATSNIEQ